MWMLTPGTIVGWALLAAPSQGNDSRRLRQQGNLFDPPTSKENDDAPASIGQNALPIDILPRTTVPSVDRAKAGLEDAEREARGLHPRFAIANEIDVDPNKGHGSWEDLDDGTRVWRYRIKAPGCNSLSFGFCKYEMPEGGRMFICKSYYPFVLLSLMWNICT